MDELAFADPQLVEMVASAPSLRIAFPSANGAAIIAAIARDGFVESGRACMRP